MSQGAGGRSACREILQGDPRSARAGDGKLWPPTCFDEPFDPALLDVPAVKRAVAGQFRPPESGGEKATK